MDMKAILTFIGLLLLTGCAGQPPRAWPVCSAVAPVASPMPTSN
ncbi:hypothetical protein OP492_20520 [Pseudomonas mosselii]|nr:hypothetical protein [Pseudomonas mosselii]MEA3237039.1 hypothetical protein [Pseudomonas mosselii]